MCQFLIGNVYLVNENAEIEMVAMCQFLIGNVYHIIVNLVFAKLISVNSL